MGRGWGQGGVARSGALLWRPHVGGQVSDPVPVLGDHWPVCARHPYTGRGHDTSAPGWECVVITAPVSALHSAIYRLHLLSAPQAGAGWRLQLHSFEQFLHGLNAQNILLRIINNNTTRRGAGMCCDAECIISSSSCVHNREDISTPRQYKVLVSVCLSSCCGCAEKVCQRH